MGPGGMRASITPGQVSPRALEQAARYEGLYASDSPWMGSANCRAQGQVVAGWRGEEMHPGDKDLFTVKGGEGTLELKFLSYLDGRARLLNIDGEILRRVDRVCQPRLSE